MRVTVEIQLISVINLLTYCPTKVIMIYVTLLWFGLGAHCPFLYCNQLQYTLVGTVHL